MEKYLISEAFNSLKKRNQKIKESYNANTMHNLATYLWQWENPMNSAGFIQQQMSIDSDADTQEEFEEFIKEHYKEYVNEFYKQLKDEIKKILQKGYKDLIDAYTLKYGNDADVFGYTDDDFDDWT